MKPSLTFLVVVSASICIAFGCKGETKFKDKQETLDKLAQTEAALKEKTDALKTLNSEVTKLRMEAGNSGDVVIRMEAPKVNGEPGAIVEIKGRGPNSRAGGGSDPKGNAKDTELYDAFVKKVKASRGSVRKCYETALKRRSDLQQRSVIVRMTVEYRTSGQVRSSRFDPELTPAFGNCMRKVATRWKLPAMPEASRFTYPQKLTPQ